MHEIEEDDRRLQLYNVVYYCSKETMFMYLII